MFRSVVLALLCLPFGLSSLIGQSAPPVPEAKDAAAIQAPVSPPLPGQLKSVSPEAPSSGRIPDLPPPALTPVPGVPMKGNAPPVSSTSTTGQFIVHGTDPRLRSAFSSRCEEISAELSKLLRDKQPWALPVVVLLSTGENAKKAPAPTQMVVSQLTHGGFHLQVNIGLRPDLRPADVRRELIRALLAERILRDQKEITAKRELLLPDWIYTGVLEALDYRQRARPSTLFAALFKSGKIFGIEEIIEASPVDMDALSKTIYQTSCCALVLALLDQPDGGLRLGKFLNSLASDPRSERELLNQWFPNFASSPASLNKWWSLQMAALSNPTLSEPLSAAETMRQLDDALTLRFQARASELPQTRRVLARRNVSESEAKPLAASPEAEPEKRDKPAAAAPPKLLSRKETSHEDIIEGAIQEVAKAEAGADVEAADAAPAKPSLFRRWFGGGKEDDKPEAPTAPEEVAELVLPGPVKKISERPALPKKVPEKKDVTEKNDVAQKKETTEKKEAVEPRPESPAPVPPSEASEEKKGSSLNPLNWFRSNKKEKEEAPEEAPKTSEESEKKSAALSSPAAQLLWAWSPMMGDGYAALSTWLVAEDAPPRYVEGFLGLKFGRKKDEEKAADEGESAPESKPVPEVKAKPEPKKEKPEPAKASPPAEVKPAAAPEPAEKPAKKADEAPESDEAKKEEPRRRSLFGLGRKAAAPDEETKDAPPATKDAPASEAKPAAPAPAAAPEPAEKPAKKADEAPESDEAKKEEPRRRSLFGWGRKAATQEEETKADAPPATTDAPASEAKPAVPAPAVAPEPAKVAKKPAAKPDVDESLISANLPIEDYSAILKRQDRKEILTRNVRALARLQSRAAVLFRPIIKDYSQIALDILAGKTKGIDARLKDLDVRTERALAQSRAVRDQLDLHEANESQAMSGLFEDYLNLPETIRKEMPERDDPIARYLDALDKEFSKP